LVPGSSPGGPTIQRCCRNTTPFSRLLVDVIAQILYNTYMKKTIIVLILTAMTATSSFARDITVSFKDGSTHQYLNTPEYVTPQQIQERVGKDFPSKTLVQIDGGRPTPTSYTATPSAKEDPGVMGSGWYLLGAILVAAVLVVAFGPIASAAGGCQHDSDRAKDGSRCGARSADSRPGGR